MTEYTSHVSSREHQPQPSDLEHGFEANLRLAGAGLGSYAEGVARADIDTIMMQSSPEVERPLTPLEVASMQLSNLTIVRQERMVNEDKPFLRDRAA